MRKPVPSKNIWALSVLIFIGLFLSSCAPSGVDRAEYERIKTNSILTEIELNQAKADADSRQQKISELEKQITDLTNENQNLKSENTKLKQTSTPAPTPSIATTTSLVEYTNAVYGISIKYPQDWLKLENVFGAVVAFSSPTKGASDSFFENLNILVQDAPMSLDSYTLLSLNQGKVLIPNYTLIESLPTTLAGNPAFKAVYTGKQGENSRKWMQVWTIKDNKAYVVTYTAAVEQYQNYLAIIQEMIASFIISRR